MELIKKPKFLIYLSFVWISLLLILGAWWIYLITTINLKEEFTNINKMMIWEGITFFILIFFLSLTIFFLYIKNIKKTNSMQAFFSSLTHELKTPLASIRLQAEVINDFSSKETNSRLHKLTTRLIEDTHGLENQMDKILQLSRVEKEYKIRPQKILLKPFLEFIINKNPNINTELIFPEQEIYIMADEFLLELNFRNLFENTKIHSKSNTAIISTKIDNYKTKITYQDQGSFQGESKKLGELFYKHKSKKGSGIGLYLIKKLIEELNGTIELKAENNFTVNMILPTERNE